MKRLALLIIMLLAASCGGGAGLSPSTISTSDAFTLSDVQTIGTGKIACDVTSTAAGPVVSIRISEASGLKGAFASLNYPASKYHPVRASFGDFVGTGSETISLAVTDRPGVVPAGIVKLNPGTAQGVSGSGVMLTVWFADGAASRMKSVSSAPGGNCNKPTDLSLIPGGGAGEYNLEWHERNTGDYDNSGVVGVTDITPIAQNYGSAVPVDDDDSALALVDGDGSNTIGVTDITPIAQNFGSQLAGYNIYISGVGPMENPVDAGLPLSVMRPDDPAPGRVEYSVPLTLVGGEDVTVRTADAQSSEGVESDPAEIGTGDIPAAPRNLYATATEAIGVGKILLSWSANTETNLDEYRIYRRDGASGTFAMIDSVSSNQIPLLFTDNNGGSLLELGVEYTYYITAVNDSANESAPSNEDMKTPFYPAAPSTPLNCEATDQTAPYGLSVFVTWDVSVSDYLAGYEVFRKAEGEADFSLIGNVGVGQALTIHDGGLAEGVNYTYRVQAFDQYGQRSAFSNESTSQCSAYVPVTILSAGAGKTTWGPFEHAQLTADITNPLATVTWSAPAGTFPNGNTGASVVWDPPASPAKVTISVHADDGSTNDDSSFQLTACTMLNLGPAPTFASPSLVAPTAPYRNFSTYLADHYVITIDFGSLG